MATQRRPLTLAVAFLTVPRFAFRRAIQLRLAWVRLKPGHSRNLTPIPDPKNICRTGTRRCTPYMHCIEQAHFRTFTPSVAAWSTFPHPAKASAIGVVRRETHPENMLVALSVPCQSPASAPITTAGDIWDTVSAERKIAQLPSHARFSRYCESCDAWHLEYCGRPGR